MLPATRESRAAEVSSLAEAEPLPEMSTFEDLRTAITRLHRNLEHQRRQQSDLTAGLTLQWERRFSKLEQELNRGLETATVATASMNDRQAKFMSLASVLESAVERAVSSSRDVAVLSQRVSLLEEDVGVVAQELSADKVERSNAVAGLVRQAEMAVASWCESFKTELRQTVGARESESARGAAAAWPELHDVDRLAVQLSEERAERRQLERDLQGQASETEKLRSLVTSTNDQLLRLSHELGAIAQSGIMQDLRGEWAMRLEALGKEVRGELGGRFGLQKAGARGLLSAGARSRSSALWAGVGTGARFSTDAAIGRIDEEDEEDDPPQALGKIDGDTGSDASLSRLARTSKLKGWGGSSGLEDGGGDGDDLGHRAENLMGAVGRMLGRGSV